MYNQIISPFSNKMECTIHSILYLFPPFNNMLWRSGHNRMQKYLSFLFIVAWSSIVYFNNNKLHNSLNQSPSDRHLGCFQFFINISSVAISSFVQTSFPTSANISLVQILTSGINCAKGKCICNFAQILPNCLPWVCTILHF